MAHASSSTAQNLIMELAAKEKEMETNSNSSTDLKIDPTFRKISRNANCFNVWKIDEDRLEAEPKSQYGTFYDNCAYIIYAASPIGSYVNQHTITREMRIGTTLERFIHFWLGDKVSESNRSSVAHKIQELDSYLGNVANEYRETQDNESARFLSYFKNSIVILSGKTADIKNRETLYQLRGRQWLRCIEVPLVSWEYFCSQYIMVFKIPNAHLFVWIGRSSSNIERRDALDLISKFQTNGEIITIVDDGYEQSMPENLKTIWDSYLPLNKRYVCQIPKTDELSPKLTNKLKIYKSGYRGTRLHLDQLDIVIPTKDDMHDSTVVYVLDSQVQGVWLWAGAQTTKDDKITAMGNGRAFVKKKKYHYSTPVIRVVEGHEPLEFTRLFPSWPSQWNDATTASKPVTTLHGKFDAMTLCQRPKMAAEIQLIDDGSGDRKVYNITKEQVIEMNSQEPMKFTTSSCYVTEYNVVYASHIGVDIDSVGIQTIIYQWNGSEANKELIDRTEKFALKTFEESKTKAMFVQMCEFDETPHFLQIFGGKLIILHNDKFLQINNNDKQTSFLYQDTFILKVYGDATYNGKGVEIYPLSSMYSKDCYVMKTINQVWVWCGNSSTGDSREIAKNIGALLGESNLVVEGKEPKEFWSSISCQLNKEILLNGKPIDINRSPTNGARNIESRPSSLSNNSNNNNGSMLNMNGGYLTNNLTAQTRPIGQLFIVWVDQYTFKSREIIAYEQTDLASEANYILDAGIITYLWLGANAPPQERQQYMQLIQSYMETIPIARRPTTAVAVVRQSMEPNVFKGFFEKWNNKLWIDYLPYEKKRHRLMPNVENATYTNGKNVISTENLTIPTALLHHQRDFDKHNKYPINILQQESSFLPTDVNALTRENHLTHDDFVLLFNMSFKDYQELPMWRQQELKKKHKLF